jgi:hypothetical protein
MKRFYLSLLVIAACLVLEAPSASAAGYVDLYGFRSVAGQEYHDVAAYFSVKFCKTGTNICFYAQLDNGGHYYPIVANTVGYYDLYLYKDYGANYGGEWGSDTQPIAGGPFYVPSGFSSMAASVPPRPLEPGLITPCNYCHVYPGNFYLKWTDGLDASRRTPVWPVTYDIWASETPVGWPTQPERLTVADAPCNPDAYGYCQWYVDALIPESGRQYTWRIVVKLQVGGGVVYTTSGPSWHLSQY